jgi:hypothetical protein
MQAALMPPSSCFSTMRQASVDILRLMMVRRVPFLVADLGPDVDPLIVHLFAAMAQK